MIYLHNVNWWSSTNKAEIQQLETFPKVQYFAPGTQLQTTQVEKLSSTK